MPHRRGFSYLRLLSLVFVIGGALALVSDERLLRTAGAIMVGLFPFLLILDVWWADRMRRRGNGDKRKNPAHTHLESSHSGLPEELSPVDVKERLERLHAKVAELEINLNYLSEQVTSLTKSQKLVRLFSPEKYPAVERILDMHMLADNEGLSVDQLQRLASSDPDPKLKDEAKKKLERKQCIN